MADFTKAVPIALANFGNEAYIQDLLASDPSLLGFGDLTLVGKERVQPSSGRLDLLFESADTSTLYEVEVQLRPTDESHIIRSIEYWDLGRRRRPNKRHVAVLVAERVTSRYFNVISLFNRQIPIAAVQMQAYSVGDARTIVFTTILNQADFDEEQDETAYQPTDRAYWISRTSPEIISIVDQLLGMAKQADSELAMKYNKAYIRIDGDKKARGFVTLRPLKKRLRLSIKAPQDTVLDELIKDANYDDVEYEDSSGRYVLWIYPSDFHGDKDALQQILLKSYSLLSSE